MIQGLILVAVLMVLLFLLGRPPKATTTAAPTRPRPGPVEPERPRPPSPLRWVASDRESGWHIPTAGEPLAAALCGHRVRGPIRSSFGARAPSGDGRVPCPACCHVADLPIDSALRPAGLTFADLVTLRAVESRGGRHRMEDPIVWPTRDPDEEDPGSRYLPGATSQPTTPGRHALAA